MTDWIGHDSSSSDADKVKIDIVNILRKHGSLDLISHFIVKEMQARREADSKNLWNELPMVPYLLGLFLSNNNLDAGKPPYGQIVKLEKLLPSYFRLCQMANMHLSSYPKSTDSIKFYSRLLKMENDVDSGSYFGQKNKYYDMLAEFNPHFIKKYGFTVENAQKFTNMITYFTNTIYQKIDAGLNGLDLKNELIIKVNDFCCKHSIKEKNKFKNLLNTFSCGLGLQQTDINPLSDNIINTKPLIKLDDQSYFITRHELDRNLDKMLVALLEKEHNLDSDIWDKFYNRRSDYLEDSVYNHFERIFSGQLFRNAYFEFENKQYETDLLIKRGNKILIVEAKSGDFFPTKQKSLRELKKSLRRISQDGMTQCRNTINYLKSSDTVIFWKDKQLSEVLTKIDTSQTKYEFFAIVVTLAQLGGLAANPSHLETLGFFDNREYPWLVNLYDLDVVTDWLNTPQCFLDYLEKRMCAQQQNIEAESELILLGYYICNGNFPSTGVNEVHSISSSYMGMFDEYYCNYAFE